MIRFVVGERPDAHAIETFLSAFVVLRRVAVPPRLEGTVASGANGVEGRQRRPQLVGQGRRDEPDAPPQLTYVRLAESLAEHLDDAGSRVLVEGGDAEERRLAAPVGAEQQPALTLPDLQIDTVEDRRFDRG